MWGAGIAGQAASPAASLSATAAGAAAAAADDESAAARSDGFAAAAALAVRNALQRFLENAVFGAAASVAAGAAAAAFSAVDLAAVLGMLRGLDAQLSERYFQTKAKLPGGRCCWRWSCFRHPHQHPLLRGKHQEFGGDPQCCR